MAISDMSNATVEHPDCPITVQRHERLRKHWQGVLCRRAGGLSGTTSWQGRGSSSWEQVYSVRGMGKQVNSIDQAEEETQYVSAIVVVLLWSAQWRHRIPTPCMLHAHRVSMDWIFLKMFVSFFISMKKIEVGKNSESVWLKGSVVQKNVHLENCVCRSRLQIFCGCEVHLTCANAAALSSFSCQAFSIFSEAFNKHRWHIRTNSAADDMLSKEGKQVGRERSQMP